MTDYSRIDAYVLRLIEESTPERTAWNLEKIREGKKVEWNYIDGCMLTALMEMTSITGDERYAAFAEKVIDHFVQEDGNILTLKPEKANLDDINEGRVLFELYKKTGTQKYRLAADRLMEQVKAQPRTWEGNFWHKAIYPDQVWLDGIYMAQPFYALYVKNFGDGDFSDIVKQIKTVYLRMRSKEKGLYFHGYDASKKAFWADPETGCSQNFWLRSLGWFAVALADLADILPEGESRDELTGIFKELMEHMIEYADPETGLYWQVPDQQGREGNYLETSGSAMMAYAMLKGARLGILPEKFAEQGEKTFNGIIDRRRRDGSYAYYISEPVVENDAKGVAPFVLAYTEIKRKKGTD